MAAVEGERRPSVFSDPSPTPNSLFGEILDWMLAPLLLIWPISIAVTHHVASEIANHPFDTILAEQVVKISRDLKISPDRVEVVLPRPKRNNLADETGDIQFFQVAVDGGELIAGEPAIPALKPGERPRVGEIAFRTVDMLGESVRVAYQLVPSTFDARPLLVQAAETRRQHNALSSRIISGVLLPQFAIIPLAVVLVWLGLSRGLSPLARLQQRIRDRRPDDLSSIDLRTVPEELRPMISAFNNNMARLRDNLDAQERFIAAAAHQLKTPLTGLKTQTELALRETDGAQVRDYLERIAGGVDHAAHMTRQLLQLARAEASHEQPQALEAVDLGALARGVTEDCVARALARDIDLGFETDAADDIGGALTIAGVPLLLREMLANLVDNAIKYTLPGGRVTVRLCAGPPAVIEIEDTGIGIPPAERDRIFERFFRVLGTEVEGSGLGLAIVREIAEQHHIAIEVLESPGGRGTLVRLRPGGAKGID